MKYVLIYWMIYALNGTPTTGTATFESQQACDAAGARLANTVKNGLVVRYICQAIE
jgi:hypothetical protein